MFVSDQFENKADVILFSFYHVNYRKKFSKNCFLKCQAWLVKCPRGRKLNIIPSTKEQSFKVISNKAVFKKYPNLIATNKKGKRIIKHRPSLLIMKRSLVQVPNHLS